MPVLSHASEETSHICLDSSYPIEVLNMSSPGWACSLYLTIVSFNRDLNEQLAHESVRSYSSQPDGTYQVIGR